MEMTWDDLKVNHSNLDNKRFLESWDWLIGNDKTPILVSSIGDVFLEDKNGKCYWLNVGEGIFEKVADSKTEFKEKLSNDEIVNEWFLIELVAALKKMGMELFENELYGYKTLPVLGGTYKPENFEVTDIEVHFELCGQIHKQIKDLPDGMKVKIVTK